MSNESLYTERVSLKKDRSKNEGTAYFEYLHFRDADLFTVVCLPQKNGKFPTVVIRHPYVDAAENINEEIIVNNRLTEFQPWIKGGYAVVFQHCRGRGKSSGDFIPYINEREDGLFLQEWIRHCPFYNGELFLYGSSYTAEVHFVTAPFAPDIKGAVLQVKDTERYSGNYRNGFFKMGLHGRWYVNMYKKKTLKEKNYTTESFHMLPLSDFSKQVFGETAEDFDEILKHPDPKDDFWNTRYGGGESRKALENANIPILLTTAFYDIFNEGVFKMWRGLGTETKKKCALVVHPFNHTCNGEIEPINFENGDYVNEFPNFRVKWMDYARGKGEAPFETGKVTYYKLFDNKWCCDNFEQPQDNIKFVLGEGEVSYQYDPRNPASFKGGLSATFGGNEWQDPPNLRSDIITLYTPEFQENTFVKGKMRAQLKVKSDCEDTCFYMRVMLCKEQGDYGIRDDINQISNFCEEYVPNHEITMDFSFDDHAFVIQKGEKLRIDISSSAFPHYVRHTNNKGLFSQQTDTKIAQNTVILKDSYLEIPVSKE